MKMFFYQLFLKFISLIISKMSFIVCLICLYLRHQPKPKKPSHFRCFYYSYLTFQASAFMIIVCRRETASVKREASKMCAAEL